MCIDRNSNHIATVFFSCTGHLYMFFSHKFADKTSRMKPHKIQEDKFCILTLPPLHFLPFHFS